MRKNLIKTELVVYQKTSGAKFRYFVENESVCEYVESLFNRKAQTLLPVVKYITYKTPYRTVEQNGFTVNASRVVDYVERYQMGVNGWEFDKVVTWNDMENDGARKMGSLLFESPNYNPNGAFRVKRERLVLR